MQSCTVNPFIAARIVIHIKNPKEVSFYPGKKVKCWSDQVVKRGDSVFLICQCIHNSDRKMQHSVWFSYSRQQPCMLQRLCNILEKIWPNICKIFLCVFMLQPGNMAALWFYLVWKRQVVFTDLSYLSTLEQCFIITKWRRYCRDILYICSTFTYERRKMRNCSGGMSTSDIPFNN